MVKFVLFPEIANWLIGEDELMDINNCLLTILIENAHENTDILLPTLQFVEVSVGTRRVINGHGVKDILLPTVAAGQSTRKDSARHAVLLHQHQRLLRWHSAHHPVVVGRGG